MLRASGEDLYLASPTKQSNALFGSDGGKVAGFDITSLEPSGTADSAPDPSPVPEPSTLLLFGSGLVGLAGLGRKELRRK